MEYIGVAIKRGSQKKDTLKPKPAINKNRPKRKDSKEIEDAIAIWREKRWADLLEESLTVPGEQEDIFKILGKYSILNQKLISGQLRALDKPIEPVATFKEWKALGAFVKKGEKGLYIIIPKQKKYSVKVKGKDEERTFTDFILVPRVFGQSQTTFSDKKVDLLGAPENFNIKKVLQEYNIKQETKNPYHNLTTAGASWGKNFVINVLLTKESEIFTTTIHEIAHILLEHTTTNSDDDEDLYEFEAEGVTLLVLASLGLNSDGQRNYIQNWYKNKTEITDQTARRIFTVADKILKAGVERADAITKIGSPICESCDNISTFVCEELHASFCSHQCLKDHFNKI